MHDFYIFHYWDDDGNQRSIPFRFDREEAVKTKAYRLRQQGTKFKCYYMNMSDDADISMRDVTHEV
jgi:hypothetical protein